jgi:hypothetical protein
MHRYVVKALEFLDGPLHLASAVANVQLHNLIPISCVGGMSLA